jgi:hypothetical protein
VESRIVEMGHSIEGTPKVYLHLGDHERNEQGSPRGVYYCSIQYTSGLINRGVWPGASTWHGVLLDPRSEVCSGRRACGAARIVGLEENIFIFSKSVQDPEQMELCQRKSLRCADENDKTIWVGDAIVCIKKA